MKNISNIISFTGVTLLVGAIWLHHLAETRMGVMRDLSVRNAFIEPILFDPTLIWAFRGVIFCCILLFLKRPQGSPLMICLGILAAAVWLYYSFFPAQLGLAAPWVLMSLSLVVCGGVLRRVRHGK